MSVATNQQWDAVERWSPVLLLTGGGLLVGHALLLGLEAFTTLAVPPDVFGPTGHLAALAGLLGLYPKLAARTPTTARIGVIAATVALLGWASLAVARFLSLAGIVSGQGTVLPGSVVALAFLTTILAYLVFGVTTFRMGRRARTVGLLVMAPGALIVVALLHAATTGVTAHDAFVIGSGLALAMLALGYRLRTWNQQADQRAPTGNASMG